MLEKTPIAIVGLSCRFPYANNLKEFWQLLINGENTITEMPEDRWDLSKFYDPDPLTPNKAYQKFGSFLKNIHDFDPVLFNISPAEAIEMSPSQKLMLELVWEAIEESNLSFDRIAGEKAGVYIGNIWSDFEHERKHRHANVTSHSAVGQSANIIANRVSYTFGFRGPSLVVDTGCSSSLVALHLACQSIWEGQSNIGVVGGINHILDHDQYVLLSKFGGLSKKGQCSTWDADADGFVRGEGAGVVLLKPLAQAEKDGDHIFSVIRGTSMNNNGFNVNLPATSVTGQREMLEDAYTGSGISPDQVHYVEAHGTGTKLGDPTETKAIGSFFAQGRSSQHPLRVGSVKTNIGHLEGAAGIAGLIKVVLAMQHRTLPKSLNFKNPNPEIPFDELKVQVQHQAEAWPTLANELLTAGVNSFGWGGTNAHTVLQEYRQSESISHGTPKYEKDRYIFNLSAKTDRALHDYLKAYKTFLEEKVNGNVDHFRNICMATTIRKPSLDHRVSLNASSKQELVEKIDFVLEEQNPVEAVRINPDTKIAFIFPGQGSQWIGMGRELMQKEPIFKKELEICERAFEPHVDWSLIEQLQADESESRMKEINVIQPTLFAIEVALAKLWQSWGIMPDAVVGHSMGEVASAYISGALSMDDAANVICSRSKLMRTVSGKGGAMAVTELKVAEAEAIIEKYDGKLSVAVSNSPKSTVIAGDESALLKVLEEIEAMERFCRQVKVDVASHSPQMDPLMVPLAKSVASVNPQKSNIPFYSTVFNQKMEGEALNASYWVNNLRGMVRFSEVISQLIEDGFTAFIEMSPHPVLSNAINECAEAKETKVAAIASLLRDKPEEETLFNNLGKLYEQGFDINWRGFYKAGHSPMCYLPGYPMQRETYELEDRSDAMDQSFGKVKNPVLGRRIELAGIDDTFLWENKLSLENLSYMKDHQVNQAAVLPGVSYLEMIHAALNEAFGKGYHEVKTLQFKHPVYLYDRETIDSQLKIVRKSTHEAVFKYFTKSFGENSWQICAEGELVICGSRGTTPTDHLYNLRSGRNDHLITKKEFYKITEAIGLSYGPLFQGINWIKLNENQAIAHVVPNTIIAENEHPYFIHPAVLDTCFQAIFSTFNKEQAGERSITTFLSQAQNFKWYYRPDPADDLIVKVVFKSDDEQTAGVTRKKIELSVYDENGHIVAELYELEAVIIDNDALGSGEATDWLYHLEWQKSELPKISGDSGTWLIFRDHVGVSKTLATQFRDSGQKLLQVSYGEEFMPLDDNEYLVDYHNTGSIKKMLQHVAQHHSELKGIVHAAALNDHIDYQQLRADDLEQLQNDASYLLLHLQRALSEVYPDGGIRLMVLTNGLMQKSNKNPYLNIYQAPLWGLSKVLFNEAPSLQVQRIDLSYFPEMEEITVLGKMMASTELSGGEYILRENDLYKNFLKHESTPAFQLEQKSLSTDGTYVVTGFRGAAFPVVEWLQKRGVRNFALISRSGSATEAVMNRITAMRQSGLQVKIVKADVSGYDSLSEALDSIRYTMPAIKGIVHAAGVIEACRINELDEKGLSKVLAPKMRGTWNLHWLTQQDSLETFLMFSSASSLIGLSGQGSYVAANTFIDQMAHYRNKLNLPATAINWGVISDVGMVADEAELERYARAEGFIPFKMQEAVEVLDKIFDMQPVQKGIMQMDIETAASYYSPLAETGFFANLLQSAGNEEAQIGQFDIHQYTDKENAVEAIRNLVTSKVAAITKASSSMINGSMTFKNLGVDSLMAIQLRNQLEAVFNTKLAVTNFWKHPSISEFSNFLYKKLEESVSIETDHKTEVVEGDWFVKPNPNSKANIKLFCFHDAGGSTSLYQNWTEWLDESIELIAIELPGRGSRITEQASENMEKLADQLSSLIESEAGQKPFMFFGHSMGGAILLEVTRKLREKGFSMPLQLFTSSTPALDAYNQQDVAFEISEEELILRFPHLSSDNIGDEELRQMFIKILRADLRLLTNYKYEPVEAFDIPITSLRGTEDDRISLEQIKGWQKVTSHSHKTIERKGGHRYIEHDTQFLTSLINKSVKEKQLFVKN